MSSKIDMQKLHRAAQEGTSNQEERFKKKQERIQECIKQFDSKCDSLHEKYFDNQNSYSIPSSLLRACKRGANDKGEIDLYMNFDRNDFLNWHKFVPFKADEFGKNYNARPSTCLHLYLTRAKKQGYLDDDIKFDVWGNKKFTVHFSFVPKKLEDMKLEEDITDAEDGVKKSSEA